MSADPHRRRLLGLFASAPLAAAAGVQPASVLGRARMLSLRVGAQEWVTGAMARARENVTGPGLQGIEAAIERAHPLDRQLLPELADVFARLDAKPAAVEAQLAAEARAIAAVALVYPPEIAAFRSFGAPMRRRLYAELLTRESARLAAAGEPSPAAAGAP